MLGLFQSLLACFGAAPAVSLLCPSVAAAPPALPCALTSHLVLPSCPSHPPNHPPAVFLPAGSRRCGTSCGSPSAWRRTKRVAHRTASSSRFEGALPAARLTPSPEQRAAVPSPAAPAAPALRCQRTAPVPSLPLLPGGRRPGAPLSARARRFSPSAMPLSLAHCLLRGPSPAEHQHCNKQAAAWLHGARPDTGGVRKGAGNVPS